MDPLKTKERETKSSNDFNKLSKQKDVDGKIFGASGDMNKKCIPQSTKDKVISDEDKCKMDKQKRSPVSCEASKDKCITELFPWLDEATKFNLNCIGSFTEVKPRQILIAMDTVIENLSADHDKYSKSPKISRALAGYLRRFLFSYRYLYTGFEKGKDYFQRITRLLSTYTDLELLASVLGKELDADVTNRIQLNYITYLKYADETSILDVLMNVKRIVRLHGGILSPLLRHNLVKLSVTVPVEVDDYIYMKHLIAFKKWFGIANYSEERETIRRAFISQLKPQKSFGSNSIFAPYLPVEKETTTPTEHFVHLLDTRYSLEPIILLFKPPPSNDQPNYLAKKIQEIVILSDDEDDSENCHSSKVKIEPGASSSSNILDLSNASSSSNMVDLTDEVYNESDVPRHYISWLADLVERAKAKAKTVDQRLEVASVSDDVIVIDDSEEVNEDEIEIQTKQEPQNENSGIEVCESSTELIDSDATPISNNQLDQLEQSNDTSTKKQLNNSNEESTDSISLDVSQIDGVSISPLINIGTVNINSCSDIVAEQITNIDLGNQEVSEQHAITELTPFVDQITPTASMTNDSEIINDSVNHELLTNKIIPTPTILTEPVMTKENVMNEDLIDNTRIEQHLTQDDSLIENYRSNAIIQLNNVKQSTNKSVHTARHHQSNDNNEYNPMNNEHEVTNTTQCSIPLAQFKTNPLMLKNSDEQIKRPEQSQQNDKIDIDATNCDRNGIQKMSPNPNSDRTMSRLTQTATNETNNTSDNNVPLVIRRKVTEQIDNESIPSTIMERKTYIKPVNVGIKSTNISQKQINGRQNSSHASATASDSINEHQNKQATPVVKNAAIASVQQPPQTYKVFYSDIKVPCLTPYDKIPAKYLKKSKRSSKPAKTPSLQSHLKERFEKCNITQESFDKAVSQLAEIYKNTSPIKSAVTITTSVPVERRNGRRFPASTSTTTAKQATAATTKTPAETKRSPATRMPMPNYIVTKVTEKKRISVNNGTKNLNQTPSDELLNKIGSIKSFRGQHEIAKTDMLVESQKQKPLNIFNKCDSNSMVDNRANKVCSLNSNTHSKSSIEAKLTQKNCTKPMGFHVKNVRTTVKNDPIQIGGDIEKSQRSPTECKIIMNGSKALETSGKKFRLVKVVEVKSVKSIPKAYTEKVQMHVPNLNYQKVLERRRSSSVPRTQSINAPSYENPKKLFRRNSCYIEGIKTNRLVEEATAKSKDFAELYDVCSNIILMGLPNLQIAKKRGRPKKPIYKSIARNLLNSADFSIKADLLKLSEQYCKEKNSFFDEMINFHMNTGLEKLSRLKTNNNNSSIGVLSISPHKSELFSHFPDDHNQEIGDLFESAFIENDLDSENNLTIEYLSDIDELKSPAYEPHLSANASDSTNDFESTVQMNKLIKLNNDEQFYFVNADLYASYLYQDSFVFNDVANEVTVELTNQMSKTLKNDRGLSPIRKSSRKRKIPVALVGPVKRTRR